jgi:hypothetical protein
LISSLKAIARVRYQNENAFTRSCLAVKNRWGAVLIAVASKCRR